MTNIKDIYCIDINWINSQIKVLQESRDNEAELTSWWTRYDDQINNYEEILRYLKPIIPLIEDAITLGSYQRGCEINGIKSNTSKENYINTKQFEL